MVATIEPSASVGGVEGGTNGGEPRLTVIAQLAAAPTNYFQLIYIDYLHIIASLYSTM